MTPGKTGLLWLLLWALPCTAWAHRVSIFAYVEGDSILTQSYFSDGTGCRNSQVTLYGQGQRVLAQGATDQEGHVILPVPDLPAAEHTDLKVVLDAGLGHRAEYTVRAVDVWPGGADQGNPPPGSAAAESAVLRTTGGGAVLSTAELDAAVERRLAPLAQAVRDMQRSQERASLRDIVGGIGYILGLLGVYAYFQSKRR